MPKRLTRPAAAGRPSSAAAAAAEAAAALTGAVLEIAAFRFVAEPHRRLLLLPPNASSARNGCNTTVGRGKRR